MLQRWVVRTIASTIGLAALLGVGILVKTYGMKDPARERFKESVAVSGALRMDMGRDSNVTIDLAPGYDDQVIVRVKFPDPPQDPGQRKDLIRATNMIARRFVHHVKDVKVQFEDEPEVIPSWDGGVAVAGTPQPIVQQPVMVAGTPDPPRIGVAPVGKPDAGTPAKPVAAKPVKMGTVTLVTFPEADVFKGRDKLGRTPMFNVDLPVGTHLLTLVGEDGLRHRLSLPVKAGKNKPLKMNLADLPAK